jgi:hypothetical protein
VDHRVLDVECGVTVGQVQQHQEAGAALDQGADRCAVGADDQVAFPVPGNCSVVCLGGAFGDHHHVGDPAAPLVVFAVWFPDRSAGAQMLRQLLFQAAAGLDIERLVDRLVGHPHLRIVREVEHQSPGDLLRRLP